MFYIKSDNIEELFREAAEKYQIDTAGAEAWDDVQAAVHADDTPPPPEGKKKRRWFVLAWLLLIPLGWFAHNAWTAIQGPGKQKTTEQIAKTAVGKDASKTVYKQNEISKTSSNALMAVATTPNNTKFIVKQTPNTIAGKPVVYKQGGNLMQVKQAEIAGATVNASPGSKQQPPGGMLNSSNPASTSPIANNSIVNGNNVATQPSLLTVLKPNNTAGYPTVVAGNNSATPADTNYSDTIRSKPVLSPNPVNKDVAADKKTEEKQKDKNDHGHYFYIGLSAAPDVSFIHMQKTSTLGKGFGVVVGYHINKNLSVESGALVEKKFYYTNGEYFNTSKIPYFVANNITPKSVSGNCNMIEIPLNLKYTFKTKGKNNFYAIGGVSSYLMGHENYTFDYINWGSTVRSSWAYNNKSNYLFSVLNLGAGYERKLGTKTNLRIEPYFKLPLSGFGTGNLKIASTGLYFTLTRKIF